MNATKTFNFSFISMQVLSTHKNDKCHCFALYPNRGNKTYVIIKQNICIIQFKNMNRITRDMSILITDWFTFITVLHLKCFILNKEVTYILYFEQIFKSSMKELAIYK